jgi:hypothetical protein
MTFEQNENEFNTWRINTFVRFCKDFKIPCKPQQQLQVFNRSYQSQIDFTQFKNTLGFLFPDFDQAVSFLKLDSLKPQEI